MRSLPSRIWKLFSASHRAVGGRGRVDVQAQREHRRRPLRGEVGPRRAVQRIVALDGDELGGIGETA